VPYGYCDRDRSTRSCFAAYSVPTLVSERLEGDIGLRTVTFDFASQSLTCLSTANLCVPVKVLTFMGRPKKDAPVWSPPGLSFARNQPGQDVAQERRAQWTGSAPLKCPIWVNATVQDDYLAWNSH
jgi:hypothetical protein